MLAGAEFLPFCKLHHLPAPHPHTARKYFPEIQTRRQPSREVQCLAQSVGAVGIAHDEAHLGNARTVVGMHRVVLAAGGAVSKVPVPSVRLVDAHLREAHLQGRERVFKIPAELGHWDVVKAQRVAERAVERAEAVVGEVEVVAVERGHRVAVLHRLAGEAGTLWELDE